MNVIATRVYGMDKIRELFKGLWLPTSIGFFLKREKVRTFEVNGKTVWDADAVDELVKEIRR